ncbi:MAG: DUF3800 domain-containing protein [Candidatus Giovannonibacteria bacterium]|nr:DUF3800 domain-containing protein [Candidatus Giovannonibacteria bacterium]
MLIFIDDSGDAGFKVAKGSTPNFVISLVIFEDHLEAEKTAVAIKELKRKLGFPDDMEFRFFKSSRKTREAFLRAVNPYKFQIRSLVVDKSKIKSEELKNSKESFYSYFIKMALKYSGSVNDARVKIDGSGDRVFRRSFLAYLRRELNSSQRKIIKNCKLVDSRGNVLIQMADMIAGSIRRSYDVKAKDSNIYKEVIKKHIIDEWSFK